MVFAEHAEYGQPALVCAFSAGVHAQPDCCARLRAVGGARPGDAGFDQLAAALNETLSAFKNRDLVPIGIGDETLRAYYEEGLVVEAFYATEVRFNLPARFEGINTLLIPVDARHAENNYVFLGRNREFLASALQVESREPLDNALRVLGYLE